MKKLLLFFLLTINYSSLFSLYIGLINNTGKVIKFELLVKDKQCDYSVDNPEIFKSAKVKVNSLVVGIRISECNGNPLNVKIMFSEIYRNPKSEYLLNLNQKENGSFYIEYVHEFQACEFHIVEESTKEEIKKADL